MESTGRMDTLGFEFAGAILDGFFATQERTTKMGQAYLQVIQESQKTGRELAHTWLKQTQELQTLSLAYLRESVHTGNEAMSDFIRVQDEVRQEVKDRFDQQMTELEKVSRPAM
jgi:hypothetical protein